MQDERALGFVGEEDQIEAFEHILRRIGDVGVPGELEDDIADLGATDAADLLQAADDTRAPLRRDG